MGFLGILLGSYESLGNYGDSPGFLEKCTRFLKCRAPWSLGRVRIFRTPGLGYSIFEKKKEGFFSELCKIVKRAKSFFLKVKIIHVKYQI